MPSEISSYVGTALRQGAALLAEAGVPDPELDARYLLAHVLGCPQLQVKLEPMRPLDNDQWAKYEGFLVRRATREPLQYILGDQGFMGHTFAVRPGVLIPRQDTEVLAEAAIDRIGDAEADVLDLCTGSGALAISIKMACGKARCAASDVSPQALMVARENAAQLGVEVTFYEGDLFAPLPGESRFDVIVCNPPYVETAQCADLQLEVLWEPMLALDGGVDGLTFYRRLATEAPAYLREGGVILVEVGAGQAEAVWGMFEEAFQGAFVLKDYAGIGRVVGATLR